MQDTVEMVVPADNYLVLQSGKKVFYRYLVVAPGLMINWDGIKGLNDSIGKNGVISIYSYKYLDNVFKTISDFKGGNAIFTQPNTPYKCGAAPQKIMYLAEEYFNKSGSRQAAHIYFYTPKPNLFAVKKYEKALEKVVFRKMINLKFNSNLIEINAEKKEAAFLNLETGATETMDYELLHVTPPMVAPDFIARSSLSDETGWMGVAPDTLQHKKYFNIFGLGDVISANPTSKTGAAAHKQASVVVANLISLTNGKPLRKKYDGYTSCPITTGYNKVILAEFNYKFEPRETFPFDQSKERRSMFFFKKHILPFIYWNGMLKGLL